MKRKNIALLLSASLLLTSCGGEPATNENVSTTPQENAGKLLNDVEPPSITPEENSEKSNSKTEYSLGDAWTVDGQWSLTIESITEIKDRNEYTDQNPAQVFIINYIYENLGYEDRNEIMDGLYFDLSMEQIVDGEGFMGYSYPGDITNYPKQVPVGAKCKAQACIGVDNKSSEIKLNVSQYDGTGTEQTAQFVLSINE